MFYSPLSSVETSVASMPVPRDARDDEILVGVHARSDTLVGLSKEQLRERAEQLRLTVLHESVDAVACRVEAFALMYEALRRRRGIALYDVQLLAGLALARGQIAEMETGEGKTFACAPAALLHSLSGRGVHVATPNVYLAKRDFELVLPAFEILGVHAGLLDEHASDEKKRLAYRCDVTYGAGYEFGFDYLRDQLTLRQYSSRPLGRTMLERLAGVDSPTDQLLQRGLYYAIVDEADHVLLDDAASPLVLSATDEVDAPDAELHRAAGGVANQLLAGIHFRITGAAGVELTRDGIARIHQSTSHLSLEELQRTWSEYVEQALQARLLKRDVHYVVDKNGAVQIVDGATGRIFSDRTWSDGLHQAVEAKEGVRITSEKPPLAQITRQRFARLYERLAGMTGTAAGCEREFVHVYHLDVQTIPLRKPSRREEWPTRFFATQASKWDAIAESVAQVHAQGRPVLAGARSIADSVRLAELFQQHGMTVQLLNGRQDAEEAAVISRAGVRGAVTIATNLAGRGTDIKLAAGVDSLGGLHVVVSECGDSARVDRQLVGRAARQGDPGSAQLFVSAEDALIQHHGTWLARTMLRLAGARGELNVDLTPQLRRVQRVAERMAYAARSNLLRRDLSRDSLYSKRPLDL
jgi:preprotein translocase subunit SecA